VAAKYGISRERQDKFAVESFRKAARARKEGKFQGEIVPVRVSWRWLDLGGCCFFFGLGDVD
jgi:acetyl-CoA acetyltransferase